jgi:hypothetical protein
LLDEEGTVLDGFTREDCRPFTGDSTGAKIQWRDGGDLSTLRDRAVKIRFLFSGAGSLWSFWVAGDDGEGK